MATLPTMARVASLAFSEPLCIMHFVKTLRFLVIALEGLSKMVPKVGGPPFMRSYKFTKISFFRRTRLGFYDGSKASRRVRDFQTYAFTKYFNINFLTNAVKPVQSLSFHNPVANTY